MIKTELVFKKNYLPNFIENLKTIDGRDVKYGFFEGTGIHSESGFNAPTLMGMHELRIKQDVPQRRVIGESLDLWRSLLYISSIDECRKYLMSFRSRRNVTGARKMFANIGNVGANMVKDMFGNSFRLAPNSPATAARKGFNKPMIEFGELRTHAAYKTSMNKKVVRAR